MVRMFIVTIVTIPDFNYYYLLAKQNNITLEVISFMGDIRQMKKGKGYGEGEIIRYTVCSLLMKECKYFIKSTGRLKIKNIRD